MRKLVILLVAAVATLGVAQDNNLSDAHTFTAALMLEFTTPYEYVDCPFALPENGRTQTCLVMESTPMFLRLAVDVTMSRFDDVWPITKWTDDHANRVYVRTYAFQPSFGSIRAYGLCIGPDGADDALLWVVEYPIQ